MDKGETRETQVTSQHINKRKHERYNVGNFPVKVKKTDGTILNAILKDISYRGFQIVCNRLTAHILSQETGLLTDDDTKEVEIAIKIQSKDKVEKIIADCRLVYIAINEDAEGKDSHVVGLQVKVFKGKSLEVIKRLVKGLTLKSGVENAPNKQLKHE